MSTFIFQGSTLKPLFDISALPAPNTLSIIRIFEFKLKCIFIQDSASSHPENQIVRLAKKNFKDEKLTNVNVHEINIQAIISGYEQKLIMQLC